MQCVLITCLFFSAEWHWESIDGSLHVPLPPPSFPSFLQEFDLCVTGEGLARLSCDPRLLNTLLPHIQVFARVSPKQKVGPKSSAVNESCYYGHTPFKALFTTLKSYQT